MNALIERKVLTSVTAVRSGGIALHPGAAPACRSPPPPPPHTHTHQLSAALRIHSPLSRASFQPTAVLHVQAPRRSGREIEQADGAVVRNRGEAGAILAEAHAPHLVAVLADRLQALVNEEQSTR